MLTKIIFTLIIALYLVYNFAIAKLYSAKEMRESFVDGQYAIGMVCTNAFYAPAWILKFLRFVILALVK